MKNKLLRIYDKQYKKLLAFSILLLITSLFIIGFQWITKGEIVEKGVKLKGGLTITLPATDVSITALQDHLSASFPDADITARGLTESGSITSIIIESSDNRPDDIIESVRDFGISVEEGSYNTDFIDSTLGESFYRQTIIAVAIAFILMAAVVYFTFRQLLPSTFVMLAAFSNIVSTLATISLLDVRLSTAGIAAFLMLIGYSVDTDILLTTRAIKSKEGTPFERISGALKTGLLMSGTSLGAVLVAYIFTQSDTIKQIMLILAIGLVFDIIYTWFQNAGILRMSLEK